MIICSFFISLLLFFIGLSYGADSREITLPEAKEENRADEGFLNLRQVRRPFYRNADLLNQIEEEEEKLSDEEYSNKSEALKGELVQWAIKELHERNTFEVALRKSEQRKKLAAAVIGLASTVISIVIPILFSDTCDPYSEG